MSIVLQNIDFMPPAVRGHLQSSHKQKGSLVQRELARERLRDCKSLEFAEKKKIVCVRYNPCASFHSAPPLTQGRLISAPPHC